MIVYSVYINNEKYATFADKESAKRCARQKRDILTKVDIKQEK